RAGGDRRHGRGVVGAVIALGVGRCGHGQLGLADRAGVGGDELDAVVVAAVAVGDDGAGVELDAAAGVAAGVDLGQGGGVFAKQGAVGDRRQGGGIDGAVIGLAVGAGGDGQRPLGGRSGGGGDQGHRGVVAA